MIDHPNKFYFFFNDTATTEIYTLSLHDALPIFQLMARARGDQRVHILKAPGLQISDQRARAMPDQHHSVESDPQADRKSTRLNSSHANISYAVFCLKKKHYLDFPILLYTTLLIV